MATLIEIINKGATEGIKEDFEQEIKKAEYEEIIDVLVTYQVRNGLHNDVGYVKELINYTVRYHGKEKGKEFKRFKEELVQRFNKYFYINI